MEQMAEVYQDGSLIADALAEIKAAETDVAEDAQRRIAVLRQELAGARRALDRYFAAFEEGSLAASDCQHRIRTLNERMDALIAEEQRLEAELRGGRSGTPTAHEIAEWAAVLPELLTSGSAQQRKALIRKLVKEIRVMGRDEIVPIYRIPALVRAPQGWVERIGLEPTTPCLQSRCSTN
jgi:exonuclease VII small subunit